jgi:DNA polymerase (family 10)
LNDYFSELADLLELRGETADAAALRRAAVPTRKALDARTRARVDEIIAGRGQALVRAARRELPRDFQRLLQTAILSTSDLALLHRQLDILTTGDLALALEGHVVAHHGVPEDVAARARQALDATGDDVRLTLGRAWDAVEPVLQALLAVPVVSDASVAGSLRRVEPSVRDLRIVVATSDPLAVVRGLEEVPLDAKVRFHGGAGLTVMSGSNEVSIKVVPRDQFGGALLFHTGAREHLALLQSHADRAGLRLTTDGLVKGSAAETAESETAAYQRLDLPLIPAELRQGTDEVSRAAGGGLPALIEPGDIRGDLHMHTDGSDGRDTLGTMVETCAALGYEYMAITDHSQSSGASRTLSADDLLRQGEAIDRLQERFPGMRILKGVEVDILPDGRLDFPDSLLERLDVVLASLHDRAGHSPDRLLRRYRAAAEHPLVHVLTHPANRLVGRHDGYDLDYDALFELAVRTNTWLEIDGAPSHLDLDGALARRAIDSGVTVAIDSDCHHARLLRRQMLLGVGTARRGWVEPRHAINTRPLADLQPHLRRKRAGTRP